MKVFLLIISLFVCGITNATTYYISPTGNDATGNGSIGNPWKTLKKATTSVTTSGDIIHILAGIYNEPQNCSLAVGVSIEGDGSAITIVNSGVTGQWNQFLSLNSGQDTNGNQSVSGFTLNGGYVSEANIGTWVGIWVTGRSNVLIHDMKINDFYASAIIFDGFDATSPTSDPGHHATGNKFYNNTVYNCSTIYQSNFGTGCLMMGGQTGMVIDNNSIVNPSRGTFKSGWPIKYWDNGYLHGCKITNNTLVKPPYQATYWGQGGDWDFAIELFNLQGLEIGGNTIQGAIDLNYNYKGAYTYGVWIHDNTLDHVTPNYSHPESGIIFEFATESAIVENNTFNNRFVGVSYNTRSPGNHGGYTYPCPTGGCSAITNNIIRNNLFTNLYSSYGISGGIIVQTEGGTNDPYINNMQVYNNTFVAKSTQSSPLGIDFTSQSNGNVSGVFIRNNIFQGFSQGSVRGNTAATQSNILITHNDAYNNNAPNWTGGGVTISNNINSNPLFVSALSFLLQALSPCIDAGINVGLPYNGAAPDMGYAEYGGASSNPTPPIVGTITQPTCAVSTGSVALSGLPATGTWTLTRTPGGTTTTGTGTSTTVTGIPAGGTYTFTVSNASGTSAASANVVINAAPATPAAPTVGTITQPTCAVATGSVILNGLPATGTWTLTRTPGGTTTTGTGTSTTISGLATGTYTYTVTNAAGCISTSSANVVINAQPTIPAAPTVGTITQPTCAVATGSVVLSGLPATGTWTITRTPGGTTTTGTGTSTTISGLAAGTYSFTVTNAGGCTSVASANVVINAAPASPAAPTVGTITQPTCAVATGSVALSGLPSTGTWTLTMTPGATTTTGTGTNTTISGLATGTYTFTVTNAAGCISTASANVVINAQPATPAAPTVGTITQPTCAVATGSVILSGLPATGTWTITRTPGGATTTGTGTSTTISGLATGTYTFTVTNAAGCISVASANVVINAQPATPSAPTVGTITQPSGAVTTGSVVLNGLPATGTWTLTMTPGGATTTGTGTSTTISGLAAGTYTFTVTNSGGCTSVASANVVINAPNIPPTANAGPDQTITLPTNSVILSGSGTDPDGNIVAYLWTKISGPAAGTITNPGTAATSVTGLVQGTYLFELRVTDNSGAFGRDTMQITVNPVGANIPPTANAGPDQTITLPTNSVILSGSGTDPDGNIVAYLWTKVSGPAAGTITNPNVAATSVTGLVQGTYLFELRVTDNGGAFGRDTMQVTVNPVGANIPPTANAGPDQTITLPTNSVILSGSGTDPDGNIVAYLWTKVSGPATGTITNPNVAATSVTGLVQGTYLFELRVTDNGGAFGRDTMQVTVNAAPSNIPPTANAGPDQTITLPTNYTTLSGSGTDLDGTIVAYLWTKVSGPAAGTISNPTMAVTGLTGLVQGVYSFELRVTDNGGAFGRDTMQVTVNSAVPNIPPTANAGADQTITLPTNSVILSGTGTDPDGTIVAYLWTKVSGPASGIITNPGSPATSVTGLAQGVYLFELRVTDNSGAFGRDTMQVTVNPAASNIPPVANAGADQTITLPTNTVILSGTGVDPDGTVVAYLWTKVSGPATGTITNPGSPATSVTGLVQGIYLFELRVTDNNGAFGRDTMQVTVNPAASNIPPVANAGADQTITLPVNAVILSGSGTDPDGNVVAYLWTKVSGPATGTITNPGSPATSVTGLVQGTYLFELRVTDNGGAYGRDTIQVTVNPAVPNIPPTANAGPDQIITLPVNAVILSGSGTDPDGNVVAYQWTKISGPASGYITNPGIAATSVTAMTQGVYLFELRVTDNSGAFGRDTVQVTVNPAIPNVPPVANAGPDQTITLPSNSATLSGSGTDSDGFIVRYDWKQISGPSTNVLFSLTSPLTFVNNLVEGTYVFELKVTDNAGATSTDTVNVTVVAIAPPVPSTQNNGIRIYPNPVADFTTLEITKTNENKKVLVLITDAQGKNIFAKELSSQLNSINERLNMTNLQKGTYLVTVIFKNNERKTLKVIKQ